ncbi:peptidase C1A [Kipferlia bialata]|uniref:Peptidase C1A n=1 Tax=Kipferlia bialata TaxID=797122 RepID=A0A9K3CZ14_9EUKA|nr:peptidase C1A [Kipferlia bialata]|eukprot:g6475.t1
MSDPTNTVYVSNLASSVTRGRLQEFFAFAGTIENCNVHHNEEGDITQAAVTFSSPEALGTATLLHNAVLDGRPINVQLQPSSSPLPFAQGEELDSSTSCSPVSDDAPGTSGATALRSNQGPNRYGVASDALGPSGQAVSVASRTRDSADQGQCGSCWAVSAAEVFSDRICIELNTSGTPYTYVDMSSQYIVNCDSWDNGCNGGDLNNVWWFLQQYGTTEAWCLPYTSQYGSVGQCTGSCTNGQQMNYYRAKTAYAVASNVSSIQSEIYFNGPVQAAFTIYQDFYDYSSGIYQHMYGNAVDGHAIKIIGWGSSWGTPYWLVQNSWGQSWGEAGNFRILRGSNECGIEQSVYAGTYM